MAFYQTSKESKSLPNAKTVALIGGLPASCCYCSFRGKGISQIILAICISFEKESKIKKSGEK